MSNEANPRKGGNDAGGRLHRLRAAMTARPDTVVGVLIVFVTVFGAFVTWRAASASGLGTDLDQRARQERILGERERGAAERLISLEHSRYALFVSHLDEAAALDSQAAREGSSSEEARALRYEADEHRAIARSLELMFSRYPVLAAEPAYDRERLLNSLLESNGVLETLHPRRLEAAADDARSKRFWLVIVDTLAAAAIFFLSLSLLAVGTAKGAPLIRRGYAYVGGAFLGLAMVTFIVVELVVTVPAT